MPPRSKGVRPKKAVRAQVNALKERLSAVKSYEWQRAQIIFDEMCELCEVKGPSGGKMIPRACRTCDYYGHTSQHCPVQKARREQMTERELQLDKARGYVTPQSEAECPLGPGQWKWICQLKEIKERWRINNPEPYED